MTWRRMENWWVDNLYDNRFQASIAIGWGISKDTSSDKIMNEIWSTFRQYVSLWAKNQKAFLVIVPK